MDLFFKQLKTGLVFFTIVVFSFAVTYTPKPINEASLSIKTAVAAGGIGNSLEVTQVANQVQLLGLNATEASALVTETANTIITNLDYIQNSVLDGLFWAFAKQVLSTITRDIVDWINSGFSGRPAFLSDLDGFLIRVADQVAGEYIESLGGVASFICSPFRLDVQISLAVIYDQVRTSEDAAPTCTLTGIIDNLQNFVSGVSDLTQGGWNDWLDITARPQVYTPYGAILSAQAGLRARLVNARGQSIDLLSFGEGFLSGTICQAIEGGDIPREDCTISKPGQFIEEQLTFTTQNGQRTLIEADEFNEIIVALIGQVTQAAVTGAAGLLGLSSGTGYTYSGFDNGSFVAQAEARQASQVRAGESAVTAINNARRNEQAALDLATPARIADLVAIAEGGDSTVQEVSQATGVIRFLQEVRLRNAPPDRAVDRLGEYSTDLTDGPTTDEANEIIGQFFGEEIITDAELTNIRNLIANLGV